MTKRIITTLTAAAVAGLLTAAPANASPETDFLAALNSAGISVYDTTAALRYGHAICRAFTVANGVDVADYIYENTSWSDVPTREVAAVWVIAAGTTLCPWHYHPERAYVA
jgi:hypothetical protein